MRIALQPSSNKIAQQHYIDTVQNKVQLSVIKQFLSDEDYENLISLYPDNEVMIWGVTPTNKSKWEKLIEGSSISLFYKNKVFFSQSLITKKLHNRALAIHLWDYDHNANTWEYIYFLDMLSPLALNIEDFNKAVGYADTYVLQGFNVLDGEKADTLYSRIDEFDMFDSDVDNSEDEYKEVVEKQFNGELDSQSKGVFRKEQGYLRNKLFKGKKTCKCAICHNEFPIQMLVAGHIKKRSKCTREEKLDVENIAMPVCKFGCDDLFEKGYIRVNNEGFIYSSNTKGLTEYVKKHITSLSDIKCLNHNDKTEGYFKWHREFHESAKIS